MLFCNKIFNIKNYEFHLSFSDVLSFDKHKINKNFLLNKKFSIHGSDYCDSNNILDIFSKNKSIKKKSNLILKNVLIFAKQDNYFYNIFLDKKFNDISY